MNTRASTGGLRRRLAGHRGTKILLAAAGAAALAATITSGPVGAVSRATGTGSPACDSGWTGTMRFNPPLMTGGVAASEGVTLSASFDCSGGTPAPNPPPSSGSYFPKGTVTMANANNCAKWLADYPGPFHLVHFNAAPLDGVVAWAPAGIDESNVNFQSVEIQTGPAERLIVTLPAPLPAVGHVTGSYASKANLTLRTSSSFAAAQTACNTTGLSSLTIVASNPGGSSQGTF